LVCAIAPAATRAPTENTAERSIDISITPGVANNRELAV
jgi:hypothetical protein